MLVLQFVNQIHLLQLSFLFIVHRALTFEEEFSRSEREQSPKVPLVPKIFINFATDESPVMSQATDDNHVDQIRVT